jgi:hypothetical protein
MNVTNYLEVTPFYLVDRYIVANVAVGVLDEEGKKLPLNLLRVQQATRGQIWKIVIVMPPRAPEI